MRNNNNNNNNRTGSGHLSTLPLAVPYQCVHLLIRHFYTLARLMFFSKKTMMALQLAVNVLTTFNKRFDKLFPVQTWWMLFITILDASIFFHQQVPSTIVGIILYSYSRLGSPRRTDAATRSCFKENLNAFRPSEHPPVRGKNVKTLRWNHRLQRPNLFMAIKRVPRCYFLHSAVSIAHPKKVLYTVANPASFQHAHFIPIVGVGKERRILIGPW